MSAERTGFRIADEAPVYAISVAAELAGLGAGERGVEVARAWDLVRGAAGPEVGDECGGELRGRLGVGQGAMRRPREAELLDEDRQGVSVKLGVEQERRLQRVEPVAGERRDLGAPGRLAEMVPVEGGVVGHQQGVAGELLQAGQRRGGGRSPVEVCVGDAGQPRDEERDRDPGVHQRREPGRDGEVLVQPHGADVDDAVVPRVEAGGLRCLLYTSDAADDLLCVDLGGRRIIKKKTNKKNRRKNGLF